MACRDGFLQQSCLKQYCSNTGGQFWSNMAGNYSYFFVSFLVCPLDSVDRFEFPFVQPEISIWGFRFWARELPENFWWKVMGLPNFDARWWKFRFSWKIIKFVELRNWTIWLRNWICGAFHTSKFIGVLRCAQYSGFRRSHSPDPWVVVVHDIGACNFGGEFEFWYVNTRKSYLHWLNMACRDGLL